MIGIDRRPSRMSKSGWEALPDVREWLGGPPGCPGVVGRPSRLSGSGERPSWMSGSCWEALLKVREALPDVHEGWEALPDVR